MARVVTNGRTNSKKAKRSGNSDRLSEEFRLYTMDGCSIRSGLFPLVHNARGTYHVSQLSQKLSKLIKSDKISVGGRRNLLNAGLEKLEEFDFNSQAPFNKQIKLNYEISHLNVMKLMVLKIPSFKPKDNIQFPEGATHFIINSSACAIDLKSQHSVRNFKQSDCIDINTPLVQAIEHKHELKCEKIRPLIMGLSVEFYKKDSDEMMMIKKNLNPCKIAKIFLP